MSQPIVVGTPAGGGLSGTYPNPIVDELQGKAVASTAPTDGQVLTWSAANNRWEPKAPQVPTTSIALSSIYEVNFAAQATRNINSPSSYVIDGMTWWVKAGSQSALNQAELINGAGLGFTWVSGACAFNPPI